MHARTLEQLDARGVADELVATGTPESTLRFLGGAELSLPRLPTRFPYVLVTPQYETERVLADRARSLGADLRHGAEVTGLARFPDGVEVIVRSDGQPEHLVRAGYVVGADGVHSTVRQALGADYGLHDPRWMSRFHSEERQVPRYRDGRFLLAGAPGTIPADAGLLAGYGDRVDTAEVGRPTRTVALIRPDAYIAWAHGPRGPAPDGDRAPQLRAALARWCGTPSRPAAV